MNSNEIKSMMETVEEKFNHFKQQAIQKEKELTQIEDELKRIQGEYRLLKEFLNNNENSQIEEIEE